MTGDGGNGGAAGDAQIDAGGEKSNDDRDGDGVLNDADAFPDDPTESVDTDGDGTGDAADTDDDGDGAMDADDAYPADPARCSDSDDDGCDDCAASLFDPRADGPDADADGICDGGDAYPEDTRRCRDLDLDGCDDCAAGTHDPRMDGDDFDMDGACDAGDEDDDDDGSLDWADSDSANALVCGDDDSDSCDDCALGRYDPSADGSDIDRDGICDDSDPDDDTDGIEDGVDNCPVTSNIGQIDQDGDGAGDLCDPSPCPGGQCLPHCKAIFDTGDWTDFGAQFAIDPDGKGGRGPITAFCMMRGDAGGGWTQVLHYFHLPGENRELHVFTDGLPSDRFSILSANFTEPSKWGHAGNAMLAELAPAEVYFDAVRFGGEGRRIDFITDDAACIEYLTTGIGNCRGVKTHFVQTPSHVAHLPEEADSGSSDQGDYAMTELPFYRAGQYNWAIRAEGRRWEVDDQSLQGPENGTWHSVWVRQRALPRSCLDVLQADRNARDGIYRIDADGWAALPAFDVFCDMTSDGGGFTKILQAADAPYTPTVDAVGDVTSALGVAKLSDAQINALAGIGGAGAVYRVQGSRSARRVYVASKGAFADQAAAWGVFGRAAGAVSACEAARFAECTFRDVASSETLDTLAWGISADDCDRYAADPGAQVGCARPSSRERRCVSAGASCTAQGYTDHALVEDLSLWIKPTFRSCRDIQLRHLRYSDGVYTIDPDGPGGVSPFDAYCDMSADGGGWTLIGKTAAGDYTALTDQQYVDLIANPSADVNPQLLRTAVMPGNGQIGFWDRAKTNALFAAGGRVVRVDMRDNIKVPANNHVYFQQRVDPPPSWDLWHALRNALLWSDQPSPDGVNVANYGVDFVLTGNPDTYYPETNTLSHRGDRSFAYFGERALTVAGGEIVTVTRFLGLLGNGYDDKDSQWLLTADPSYESWKRDSSAQRCSIWLR